MESRMPQEKKSKPVRVKKEKNSPIQDLIQSALAWLKSKSTQHDRENLTRFAISASNALGVSMANMKVLAKQLGRNHALAAALWDTGCYEARMVATMVDEPEQVTSAQMERWCRDFDNWGICDTACFCLFDRTPHAWAKVDRWCVCKEEFVKRTAFALLWSLTVHDKTAADTRFVHGLRLIEHAADDERNFVKKAVNMALRAIGKRNATLHAAAVTMAERLAGSSEPAARWVGKDALRELTSSAVTQRLIKRPGAAARLR
jgi:3-methyladenine DNA glycosylase AlkD